MKNIIMKLCNIILYNKVQLFKNRNIRIKLNDRYEHMLIVGNDIEERNDLFCEMIKQDISRFLGGITIIDTIGGITEKLHIELNNNTRKVHYIDCKTNNSVVINLLQGSNTNVISNLKELMIKWQQSILNIKKSGINSDLNSLINYSIIAIKEIKGEKATLNDLETLIYNKDNKGKALLETLLRDKKIKVFSNGVSTMAIYKWFIYEYFHDNDVFESGKYFREFISFINNNKHISQITKCDNSKVLDIEEIVKNNEILICNCKGVPEGLKEFIHMCIMNTIVLHNNDKRNSSKNTHMIYVNEFTNIINDILLSELARRNKTDKVMYALTTSSIIDLTTRLRGVYINKYLKKYILSNIRNVLMTFGSENELIEYQQLMNITPIAFNKNIGRGETLYFKNINR